MSGKVNNNKKKTERKRKELGPITMQPKDIKAYRHILPEYRHEYTHLLFLINHVKCMSANMLF